MIGNQALAALLGFCAALKGILLGPLTDAEVERLMERLRDAVMETCLAMTIFREEFNIGFVALFVTLLFAKAFHWLLQDRVARMPAQADAAAAGVGVGGGGGAVRAFHTRTLALTVLLFAADTAMLEHCLRATLREGPSMLLLFGFEYLLLASVTLSTFLKYLLHTADRHAMRGAWEAKSVYVFYVELVTDLLQLFVYTLFFMIVFVHYGLPLHLIRDLYATFRNFRQRLADFVRYRRATSNLGARFPDATPDEVAADTVCIICREDMESGAPGAARPKKLACGHVFHLGCLRSWLERQATCPTCRAAVAPAASSPGCYRLLSAHAPH